MAEISRLALTLALGTTASAAMAGSDPWELLSGIQVDETYDGDRYEVTKVFPEDVRDGIQDFFITGYAVPLTPGEAITSLILVSDMGNCPFCGSGGHAASLQVELDEPVFGLEEGTRISLRGALEAVTDTETWQATIMRNARLVAS